MPLPNSFYVKWPLGWEAAPGANAESTARKLRGSTLTFLSPRGRLDNPCSAQHETWNKGGKTPFCLFPGTGKENIWPLKSIQLLKEKEFGIKEVFNSNI